MSWLRRVLATWRQWWREVEDPLWDGNFPDSAPPALDGMDCPDTEPTSPGALDSDLGRLA